EHYIKIKDEAKQWLFQIPGVYGIALGPKIVAGKLTGEPAIQVYVENKKPLHQLPPGAIIPREIKGVRTDVIQGGGPPTRAAGEGGQPSIGCASGKVKDATTTTPVEITSKSHGLTTGESVTIVGVEGMVEDASAIEVIDGDKFKVLGTDRRANKAYNGG